MKITKKQKARSRWLSVGVMAIGVASAINVMAVQLNIYEVTDSERTIQVKSFSGDAQTACRIAGFTADEYAITGDSGDSGLIRTLTVEKKFPVRILVDGTVRTVETPSGTTAEILSRAGVLLGPLDETTPPANLAMTAENANGITVTRVTQRVETVRAELPYDTEKRTTSALDYGKTRVVREGIPGELEQTVLVTERDGAESARVVKSEQVLTAPQSQIVEQGTGGAVVTRGGDILRYKQVLDVKATAYSTEGWSHENKFTKIGTVCRVGAIAVDPKVIPLGTRMYVTSPDGESWIYGTAVAEDTGGAIKGNRIDLYFNTQEECVNFGVRAAKVYILA